MMGIHNYVNMGIHITYAYIYIYIYLTLGLCFERHAKLCIAKKNTPATLIYVDMVFVLFIVIKPGFSPTSLDSATFQKPHDLTRLD